MKKRKKRGTRGGKEMAHIAFTLVFEVYITFPHFCFQDEDESYSSSSSSKWSAYNARRPN